MVLTTLVLTGAAGPSAMADGGRTFIDGAAAGPAPGGSANAVPDPPVFEAATTIPAPFSEPFAMSTADFDGDGHGDEAVLNFGAGHDFSLVVIRSAPSGPHIWRSSVDAPPFAMDSGDLNGDGLPDLVVAVGDYCRCEGQPGDPQDLDSVAVFLGRGDGTFQPPRYTPAGREPFGIATGDLNEDHSSDVVTVNVDQTIAVLISKKNGTFKSPVTYPLDGPRGPLVVDDLDGDHHLDVAAETPSSVVVRLGKGDGRLAAASTYPAGEDLDTLLSADVNGDDVADLVAQDDDPHLTVALLGAGDGSFGDPVPSKVPVVASWSAASDLDADGRIDVAVGGYQGIAIMMGLGDGRFRGRGTYASGASGGPLAIVDAEFDQIPDILSAGNGLLTRLSGNGDGTFRAARTYQACDPGSTPHDTAVADLNEDGLADLIVGTDNGVAVLEGRKGGLFGTEHTYPSGGLTAQLAIADVNEDGHVDVLAALSFRKDIVVLLGKGNGAFAKPASFFAAESPGAIATGDLNEDGHLDLAVTDFSIDGFVAVLLGDGTGSFGEPTQYPVPSRPFGVAAGDLDNDGHLDLVIGGYASQKLSVMLGVGDGTFGSPSSIDVAPVFELALADFDGDGNLDVAAASNGLRIFFGKGDGSFGAQRSFSPVVSYIEIGDVNGDGMSDVVAATSLFARVAIIESSGGRGFAGPFIYPGQGDELQGLSVGDLNGDHRLDYVSTSSSVDGVVAPVLQSRPGK